MTNSILILSDGKVSDYNRTGARGRCSFLLLIMYGFPKGAVFSCSNSDSQRIGEGRRYRPNSYQQDGQCHAKGLS